MIKNRILNVGSVVLLATAFVFGNCSDAEQPAFHVDQISDALTAINDIGVGGEGHDEAVAAMKVLNRASADNIPQILNAMTNNNKLAVNWLRSAVIKIAGDGSGLPTQRIREYFDDKENAYLGRLLAFELLTDGKPDLANKIIPGLVDDPSLPLRYKAIAYMVQEAESLEKMDSIGMLGFALEKARNVDQIVDIAKSLDEKGISVDLQQQLGFLNNWNIVGNFNNKDQTGFEVVYGPEKDLENFDLEAKYEDSLESGATWSDHNTVDPTGLVDLNKVIGKVKGVIAYAHATYDSDAEQEVDIRIGCINAHKVWVNGELVMSNEIYHNGISPDKFVGRAKLKKGKNDILIKVCQNEQTQPWAQRWLFQVRICDESGKAIRPATKQDTGQEG